VSEKNNFALVRKPASAVEKAEPGAKRILSGMVADTLILADAQLESWCKKGESHYFFDDHEMGSAPENKAELDKWSRTKYARHCERSKEATKWFRMAAERGHARAQFLLGELYDNGIGVPEDIAEAVQWYRKAAEQGNADAQTQLGQCYLEGDHVPKDVVEAIKWIHNAAVQGHLFGQIKLGQFYKNGQDIARDYCEAYKWFKLAANNAEDVNAFNFAGLRQYAAEEWVSLSSSMTPNNLQKGEHLYREFQLSSK
jgi:TPR repeat protein